ncbi:MAG TPA: biotin--[acetyl-CoA-carboxylase] ligase [Kofleriaceae bacterium]|nr:biotin--[acetyl-CoA-carboxylase] ligase [Kofleriaceae bacterium]
MTAEVLHQIARWLGCQKILLAECGSTNDEAARLARAGARHGTVVIAEQQRAGRGRDGHVWTSPPGGLWMSAVLRPSLPLVDVPPMTLAIGIGVCEAARQAGAAAVLKWPNDVLVGGAKLAGVLVEAQSQGNRLDAVIVGIGINLNNEVPEHAISLAGARGEAVDREAFLGSLLASVERWVDRYVASGIEAIIPAWQDRMAIGLAARATIDGAPLVGSVHGLDLDGALLLRDQTGRIHRVRSGDVEVLRTAAPEMLSAM